MNKRAQSAIEFMLLVGAVFFFVIVFVGIFQGRIAEKSAEQRNIIITELALDIQNEINIAAKSTDGYTREFDIPNTIAGKEYSIGLYDGYVYLNTSDGKNAMALPTFNATGQLKKGANLIRKINSTIFVN
ncbi:hypothetical protein J4233_01270 [Candidatus Pacearchaeota archaeon]|nr:hypothetical protein [Candidatus Pacearchaeota archaeon]